MKLKLNASPIANHKPSAINRHLWRYGFTLIELLVVIVIIGILTSIGTIAYSNAQQKGRDSKRKQGIAEFKSALELARYDLGGYPPCDGQGQGGSVCAVSGTGTNPDLVPTYAEKITQDPGGSGGIYSYISVGCSGTPLKCTSYTVVACLENASDPQRDQGTGTPYYGCPKASYTTPGPT